MIRLNVEWEQVRYLASMLINVNVGKKNQMVQPDKLFPLPQDVYLERGKPKSTKDQFEAFKARVDAIDAEKGKG